MMLRRYKPGPGETTVSCYESPLGGFSSRPTGTSVKVPSLISYEDEKIRWGYQVGPDSETFRGIKLLLDEDQETRYTPSLASKPLLFKYRKNAVQVAGDYLRQLVDQVKQVLHRRFGAASAFMDLKFVLTAPAVWSDKAKDGTLRAAMQAHIPANEVSLVSEPEAAALYTLRSIQPNSIAVSLSHPAPKIVL